MENKKCTKCKKIKPTDEFYEKKNENRFSSYCKTCLHDYQNQRWVNKKLKAIDLFDRKCCECGYCKNYSALEFHHIDPTQKEFNWDTLKFKSWEKIIIELKKCILYCSNCHREFHHPNATLTEPTDIKCLSKKQITSTGNCPICNINLYGTKYCSILCSAEHRQKVKRPTRNELEILLKTNTYVSLAKQFGVSDSAIRKWVKQYNLN